MVGQRAVLLHLVELGRVDQGEGVLLAVGHLGLQGLVGLRQRQADWRGPEGLEHRHPQRHHRNADLEALQVLGRADRAGAGGDLAEAVVPHGRERHQAHLLDAGADVVADAAVHRGPHLVIAAEGEADAGDRRHRDQGRHHRAGEGRQLERAGANLRHHVGVVAELVVREQLDRHAALRFGGDGGDRFLQPDVDRVRHRKIGAELQLELGRSRGLCADDSGQCARSRERAGCEEVSAGECHDGGFRVGPHRGGAGHLGWGLLWHNSILNSECFIRGLP